VRRLFCIAILAMGFSGLVAEIVVLRELLIVFSGNELCIGIILANWLVLEAFGCFFLGRKAEKSASRLEAFSIITILFSLSLPAAILLTRLLKNAIGVSIGESIGFLPMFYSTLLILLPVSVFHGALFTYGCRIYSMFSGRDESSAGRVYVYETVGAMVGGIVCTWFLIPHLNSFQASLWLAVLNLVVCLVLIAPYWKTGLLQKAILVVLGLLVLTSGWLVLAGQADRLHDYSVRAQWKNQNVVHYQNSRYGNICTLENEGQYIFFQDGIPGIITPVPDISFVEEFVHLALLAHPEPKKLLVLSGGAGGVINEALKHPSIEAVEYAELDPLLLDLLRKFPTPLTESELKDARVQIRHMDGRLLLKTTRNKYDVILVGVGEPSNLQANRFYTEEFLSLAREKMNREGILVLGLPGSLTYSNEELKNLNSCIFNTLKRVFAHIKVIPGDRENLFLSSDSREILTIDRTRILNRLNHRNIKTDAAIPWRLENKLHEGWQDWFAHFVEGHSRKTNSDFNPVGVFYSISHWNALFAPSLRGVFRQLERLSLGAVAVPLLVLSLLCFLLRARNIRFPRASIPFCIITTGFAGMLFDLMLIFAFQAIYGYVFAWIGLLVAFFMAGAACGAWLTTVVLERTRDCLRLFAGIELAIVCWSFGWPFLLLAVHSYQGASGVFFLTKGLFLVLSLACGLLVGSQFPLANKIYLEKSTGVSRTAGLLYASDLLGGWFGGIAGAVVLLPVLGLVGTGITVGLVKLTSAIVIATGPGQHPGGGKA
jgi:spermidine synthase